MAGLMTNGTLMRRGDENNHILKGWVPTEMNMKEFLIMRIQSVKKRKLFLAERGL